MSTLTGKVRTRRHLTFDEVRKQLADAGYTHLGVLFLDRYMLYRCMVVAINHLSYCLGRDPHRVWAAVICRARRTMIGRPMTPYKQAQPTAEGLREEEAALGGLHVWCPTCGNDLIEAGKMTRDEVTMIAKSRKSHHNK